MPAKATTKSAAKPEAKPASNKKTTPAAPTKDSKKTAPKSGSKSAEKKAPRRNLNQAVAFLYGGSLVKASHVYVFAVENKDVVAHVRENLSQYFGNAVTGRSVKCENAEETLAEVLAQAEKKGYRVETECPILKCSVNNASQLLKEVAECNTANSFKLAEDEEKPAKKTDSKKEKAASVKKGKKDATAESDEDAEDDEDEAEETDEEEGEDGEDADDADDAESEEEEEKKPAAKKGVQKKADDKPAKGAAKGKDNDKPKTPKKTK